MSVAKENKIVRGSDLATVASSFKTYVNSLVSSKFGSVYFDSNSNSLMFFATDDDRESWIEDNTQSSLIKSSIVLNTSSNLIYRVALTTENQVSGQYNTIQVSANAASLNLLMNFDIQVSTLGSETWTSTGQSARFEVYTIDTNNVRTQIQLPSPIYFAGQQFSFNIMPYLSIGTTRVEVKASSELNDTITSTFTYQIVVSEMYIEEASNNWHNAIVENGLYDANYKLGGFKIVGSMSKVLHLELYQANQLVKSFSYTIGSSSYNAESPFYYTHDRGFDMQSNNSNLTTGIYMVKAYLTSDSLTSLPVIYNIMYISALDINSAELVCINNTAAIAYNYSSLILCDYAIYNKGAATGNPHLLLKFITGTTPSTKEDKDLENTTTGVLHHLEYTVEWLTENTVNLFINATLSLGSSSQVINIPIDNSATYPAETGAVFYLNSTTRNNTDTNKLKVVNEATLPSTELTPTWTKMSWVDGIDGWTVDDTGRKCLLIPAKSLMSLPYQILTGENISIEICYKVANVADYEENVITIASNPNTAGFQGIRIKPTNVTVHSSADIDASKDTERGTNFADEVTHHLMITIANTYGGNTGKNLVTGYIDGSVGFQFDYISGTSWANNVPLIIGSQYSDVYIYFIRVYNSLLGKSAVEKNYINSLNGLQVREAAYNQFYNIVKQSTHEITYENVSKSNKNFFVVEMLNGATIPSRANDWSKDTKGKSNFEMHFGAHPLWDFKLYNVETAGQGTTSMDYYRWNLRFRIDKSNDNKEINIAYYNSPTIALDGTKTYSEQTSTVQKAVYFDGGANNTTQTHPKVKRITAKINFASSMQSHKIGATRAYDDLRNALNISNAAQTFAASQDPVLPKPTVAVYQYPAFGFAKTVSQQGVATYEFIGLFTIGPDKGDKSTFGYDIDDSIKNYLITLEGTDHSRRMAKFLYPWNSNVEYRASNECINVVGTELDNGWEVSNCHGYSTDSATAQASIQTVLESEFKPAYDLVYNNSTQIFPIALGTYGATAAATLTAINADVTNFRLTQYDSKFTYQDMEFWIEGEYILYYYDIVQKKYVAGVNLITDLNQGNPTGSTLDEKNEWFKAKRRARFKASAENYWDIQDAIYHFLFILWFGATDNFAKNTYPYKMGTLANGGRWCWRQDDLDTIFDIDNTGGQTKPYYIEYLDAHNGSPYFAGSTSVFWNLLFEIYWEDYDLNKGIASLGKDFIAAMANLGTGSNTFTGCKNFIASRFWDNAQNYFNQATYNIDAVYKYEAAWLTNGQEIDPLSQSLGNHYSAEQLWVDRRIIYMMSLFRVGPFGGYSDTSLGRIAFRPKTISSFNVTPLLTVYPAIIEGAGSPMETTRTTANTVKEFTSVGAGDGNTTFYIQGTDYLTSLGDWKDIQLGTGSGGLGNVEINGKKLKTFTIGNATAGNVTTNIPSLTFPNNKCLETINARNASSLTGAIDLSNCTRLLSADFRGTNITQVTLPVGSKATELHLSDATTAIILKNLKFLETLDMPSDLSTIRTLQVENCTYQDGLDMLRTLYNTNSSALQYIRIIWSGSVSGNPTDLTMLANIKNNKDKDGNAVTNNYGGISSDGNTTLTPVIEGTLSLTTGLYTDDLEEIGLVGTPEVVDGTIVKQKTSAFGTLYIVYDSSIIYIRFADDTVKTICINNWSSDGYGVSMNDAATVTSSSLGTKFRNNTSITSFNELQYFTQVTSLASNQGFTGCTNLTSITLPASCTYLGIDVFRNCTSLSNIGGLSQVASIDSSTFYNTTALQMDISFPNLTKIQAMATFRYSGITKVLNLGSVTELSSYCFANCYNLTTVVLPNTLTTINAQAFYQDSALTSINFPSSLTTIGEQAFDSTPNLSIDLNIPSLSGTLSSYAFKNSGIKKILSLGSISSIYSNSANAGAFCECTSLTEATLPSTLRTIGMASFRNCTALTTVTVPSNSVTSIQGYAFANCSALTTFTLPTSITTIGQNAFDGCVNLEGQINLPNIASIGESAFKNAKKITSINIGGTISQLYDTANWLNGPFYNCIALTTVVLPESLSKIGHYAFRDCSALTSINLNYVNELRDNVFIGASLEGVSIPTTNAITSIGQQCFAGTKLGGEVNLPHVTYIGQGAFRGSRITSVTSLGSITTLIGGSEDSHGVFRNCTYLTSVVLPSTLIEIQQKVFMGCTSLTSITGGSNVTTIRSGAFTNANNITGNFHFPSLTTLENCGISHSKITAITSLGNITTMPDSYEASPQAYRGTMFSSCSLLASVTLPATLVTIGRGNFYESLVTTVTIPANSNLAAIKSFAFGYSGLSVFDLRNAQGNGLTLYSDCFRGCTSITSLKLPTDTTLNGGFQFAEQGGESYNSTTAANLDFSINFSTSTITSIPEVCFYRSKVNHIVSLGNITSIANSNNNRGAFEESKYLLDVVLPSTLTSIGTRAFYNCNHITTITCNATTPPTVGSNGLAGLTAIEHIYVPAASVDTYKAASGWSSYASIIEAIQS